jgi:putative two-component system response regulator
VTTDDHTDVRVLIVDDDPAIRRLLVRVMAMDALEAETAGSAGEARALLCDGVPDVALVDVRLPGESGLALARELTALRPAPAVIMVSGEADTGLAALALDAGAYGYLTKPFKPHEVTIAVRNALRRRRGELEGRARMSELEERVVDRTVVARDALSRLERAQEQTVLRLSKAIEWRDPETGAHIERMSQYCGVLAEALQLDGHAVRLASRLHDVGKIAIPESILLKAEAFTDEERLQIQRHAEVGHRMLSGSGSELLELAGEIAWTHHERYDGSGYPRRLRGQEIPLSGRVAAVADVFDALITSRPYRPAMTVDDAVQEIGSQRGRAFDPEVVDAFLGRLEDVLAIVERYEDSGATGASATAGDAAAALMTLQEAAALLGISTSKTRRWADEGRLPSVRTTGGHRRFPAAAVRRLASTTGRAVAVRRVHPPSAPIESLASVLQVDGAALAALAADSVYRPSAAGWFASDEALPALREWLSELVLGARSGDYRAALAASDRLMRRAAGRSTTVLERDRMLQRFGEAVVRALSRHSAPAADVGAARRLIAAMQEAHLASVD